MVRRRIRRDGKEITRAKSGGKEGVKKEEQDGGKATNEEEWRWKGEGWEEEGRRKGGERDEGRESRVREEEGMRLTRKG